MIETIKVTMYPEVYLCYLSKCGDVFIEGIYMNIASAISAMGSWEEKVRAQVTIVDERTFWANMSKRKKSSESDISKTTVG